MKFDKTIPIIQAFLHQAISVPGAIAAEKTLMEMKIPGIKMWFTPQGLLLEVKGKQVIVPSANVVNAIVMEDEKEKK